MARRIVLAVIGATLVLAGVAMLVLPGPGMVTILAGLGVLGMEFAFARRWIVYLKARSEQTANGLGIPSRWRWAFPVLAVIIGLATMAMPLFISVVRTPTGTRLVRKPSPSFGHTFTDTDSLRAQAEAGDSVAAALLVHAMQVPEVPPKN